MRERIYSASRLSYQHVGGAGWQYATAGGSALARIVARSGVWWVSSDYVVVHPGPFESLATAIRVVERYAGLPSDGDEWITHWELSL